MGWKDLLREGDEACGELEWGSKLRGSKSKEQNSSYCLELQAPGFFPLPISITFTLLPSTAFFPLCWEMAAPLYEQL